MTSGTHRLPKGRVRRGLGGLLLLALFLVGQAYVIVHHSFVEHHVCAADGELAHGDHEHAHVLHSEVDASDSSSPAVKAAEHESEHDEHCSVPKSRDERKHLATGPEVRGATCAPDRTGLLLVSQTFESGIPLFRLAPKQSPPAIA